MLVSAFPKPASLRRVIVQSNDLHPATIIAILANVVWSQDAALAADGVIQEATAAGDLCGLLRTIARRRPRLLSKIGSIAQAHGFVLEAIDPPGTVPTSVTVRWRIAAGAVVLAASWLVWANVIVPGPWVVGPATGCRNGDMSLWVVNPTGRTWELLDARAGEITIGCGNSRKFSLFNRPRREPISVSWLQIWPVELNIAMMREECDNGPLRLYLRWNPVWLDPGQVVQKEIRCTTPLAG